MEQGELRIGSLYNSVKFNTPVILTAEDIHEMVCRADGAKVSSSIIAEIIEPIPLTKEWLKKMPYDKSSFRFKPMEGLGNWAVEMCWTVEDEEDEWRIIKVITYVHEWQNLYDELTEEELKEV